jgi:hypothetical protein
MNLRDYDRNIASMRTELDDTMISARLVLTVLVALIGTGSTFAQVKEPPRAEKLDIQIRYRIRAERDDRVLQYRALEKFLAGLGFDDARKDDPNRDLDILDPNAERFTGTIPSAKVLDVLNDPRVMNILFAPSGYMYPDSSDKPVSIRVILRGGMLPAAQQLFHLQALSQLELLGYKDALGYDTRGYTQLKGTIPYKNLNRLVKDLRTEPSGWFFSDTPPDRLPRPFADRNPIRWVEVMAVPEAPPPFAPELVLPARARLTPELRARLVDPAAKETPLFVEVIFSGPMEDRLEEIRGRLLAGFSSSLKRNADGTPVKGPEGIPVFTEGGTIEGAIGNVITIRFDRPADAERFLLEPGVLSIRLPRRATETAFPLNPNQKPASTREILKAAGVETLNKLGYTGSGVKVIVIGSDFTGADKLIGTTLPKKTQIVDLTIELNPEILPLPSDPDRAVANIAVARSVALGAPDAELILVRIDPASFFQLLGILRLANGDASTSIAMRSRLYDLSNKSNELTKRKDVALTEYRVAFEDLADDEPTKARRARAKAALNVVIAQQAELTRRLERFNVFLKQSTGALAGARVIVNPFVWESGYPLDALSELSRTLDKSSAPAPTRSVRSATRPYAAGKPSIVWVQAASPSGPSVWGGPFIDPNRNGTMEFAPLNAPLPEGNWTPEMNFIGMRSPTGETSPELPAGARLRFTMQWRESIDPKLPKVDVPAYPVVLRVFRQLDPNGEKQPSDEMAETARSAGGPYTIARTTTYVVYEQLLEFTVPVNGRYAFIVATGYQPDPLLPALRREVEIYPRVYLETVSAKFGENQAVFRSYVTPHAGVGLPGDSPGAVTIGIAERGTLVGGGTGITLLAKPDLLGPTALDLGGERAIRGNGIATGFIAGIAADLVQAEVSGVNVFRSIGCLPGKLVVIPESWMRYLRPITRPTK